MREYIRKPNTKCAICSKDIYKRPRDIAHSKSGNIFCGKICYGISCRRCVQCTICGANILGSDNKKTCSKECADKQRAKTRHKKGWQRKEDVRSNQAIRRRVIADRGSEKCERCAYDRVPSIIHVHHIVERCKGGNDDLSNLELLCPNCHAEEHHIRKTSKDGAGVGSPSDLLNRSDT